jgi:phytoene synthase
MTSRDDTRLDFARHVDFSQVLTNPILDIAARVWDEERYGAFKVCYRTMRRIDDLIDHRKETAESISEAEADHFRRMILDWLEAVRSGDRSDPFQNEFLQVLERFAIPFWPWERLYVSMVYDLKHDGYKSLLTFLRYAEGAAIAPASVFMHLCGVEESDGRYRTPRFDIRRNARPLALFSYVVHIIRDFQKDQLNNLNYFADNMLIEFGLTRPMLREIAEGNPISSSFRRLMASYVSIARYYQRKARRMLDSVFPSLQPRYQLSLEIIYHLYAQVLEKVDLERGGFTAEELNPSPVEVQEVIRQVVDSFALARYQRR